MMRVRERRRPEGAERALLPVPERRGGLHPGVVHPRRDPARARIRPRAGALGENGLHVLDYERASEVIETATCMGVGLCYCRHKMRAPGPRVRRPDGDLHDLQRAPPSSLIRHGIRAAGRRRPRAGPAAGGLGARVGAVRRERAAARELHLQLLRLLLRGDDRGAALRHPPPRPHHQLPPRGRPRAHCNGCGKCVDGLPGRGDDAGLGERPAQAAGRRPPDSTRTSASAAACCVRACGTGRPRAAEPPRAGDHARSNSAHRVRADGRRARQAAGPDLRQPRAVEPPGARRDPRRSAPPPARQARLMARQQVRSRYLEALIRRTRT